MLAHHNLILSLLNGLADTRRELALARGIPPPVTSTDTPALAEAVLSLRLPEPLFRHGCIFPAPRTKREIAARMAALRFYCSIARPEHPLVSEVRDLEEASYSKEEDLEESSVVTSTPTSSSDSGEASEPGQKRPERKRKPSKWLDSKTWAK